MDDAGMKVNRLLWTAQTTCIPSPCSCRRPHAANLLPLSIPMLNNNRVSCLQHMLPAPTTAA